MNERIQKLAEQANAIPIHGKPKDRALVGYDNIEKFAELIVRETLDELCEAMLIEGIDSRTLPKFYEAIKKTEIYFGVEE
jgi:hypothetical protein